MERNHNNMKRKMATGLLCMLLAGAVSFPAEASQQTTDPATISKTVINDKISPSLSGFVFLPDGTLLGADTYYNALWTYQESVGVWNQITGQKGVIQEGYVDGNLAAATFIEPWTVAPFLGGYAVSDADNNVVRFYDGQTIRTAAGNVQGGRSDGIAASVSFSHPTGLAAGANGELYIADTGNNIICKMEKNGFVSVFAGPEAGLSEPTGLFYAQGTLYVADSGNHRICKIQDGQVTVLAGSITGEEGDALGDASMARFSNPQGIAVDGGRIYIADTGNGRVCVLENAVVTELPAELYNGLVIVKPRSLCVRNQKLYIGDAFLHGIAAVEVGIHGGDDEAEMGF